MLGFDGVHSCTTCHNMDVVMTLPIGPAADREKKAGKAAAGTATKKDRCRSDPFYNFGLRIC